MQYLRRFLGFFAVRLLIAALVLSLIVVGFYMGMNSSYIYILMKDGMGLRAEVIISGAESRGLSRYFEDSYIQTDAELLAALAGKSPYAMYRISSYDQNVTLNWMWSWPWSEMAQAEITDTVFNIEGKVTASYADKVSTGEITSYPPHWRGGRYRVQLIRRDGQWRIDQILPLETIIQPEPVPQ